MEYFQYFHKLKFKPCFLSKFYVSYYASKLIFNIFPCLVTGNNQKKIISFFRLITIQLLNIGKNSNSDNDYKNSEKFFFDVKCDILPTFEHFSEKLMNSKIQFPHAQITYTTFCILMQILRIFVCLIIGIQKMRFLFQSV